MYNNVLYSNYIILLPEYAGNIEKASNLAF